MSRLRVLQLVSGLAIGAESGGAELHAIRIGRYLDREAFEPAVFSFQQFGSEVEGVWLERLRGMDLPLYGMLPAGSGWRATRQALFRAVEAFRPHILHSHSERGDLWNVYVHRFHPTRPVAVRTVHIDQRWATRPYLRPLMEGFLFPRLFAQQAAVSQMIYEQLRAQGGQRALCYNGIDEAAFQEGFAAGHVLEQALPGGTPCIGIAGRLTRQKGHDVLLQALAEVVQERPVHLLIIGEGTEEAALRRQTRELGLQQWVHFLGMRTDIWAILQSLDLFVLPSRWEGFPTVLLEAMSQGVPVVATGVSGSRELVQQGETGWLVPPEDVAALAEAIRCSLGDPAGSQRMAARAKERAAGFTLQNMARCYATIYRKALGR